MKFADIAGRQEVKERLVRSVTEGRIPHALLFSGPEGNSGLPFALAFAAFIQCERRTAADSCGSCSSCLKHKKLVHPDLHFSYPVGTIRKIKEPRSADFIDEWRKAVLSNPSMDLNEWYECLQMENKQGFMSVHESQEVIRRLNLKPFESEFKILIMWQAEKMRIDEFNKMLKLIEEPPNNTIIILVTSAREQLIPTIISRTQHIKIPLLGNAELISLLESSRGMTYKDARRIAGLSGGNLNAALAMTIDDSVEKDLEKAFIDWMRLCFNPLRDYKQLNAWVDEMAASGREYQKQFLGFFLETIRECLLVNSGADALVRFDDDVIPNFSKFSKFIHAGNAPTLQRIVSQGHFAVGRNANAKILFLDLSFKISRLINAGN
jgi:DNA polymerase-3 subunit delta'